jgi:hypothetical protein
LPPSSLGPFWTHLVDIDSTDDIVTWVVGQGLAVNK